MHPYENVERKESKGGTLGIIKWAGDLSKKKKTVPMAMEVYGVGNIRKSAWDVC